jgi:MFS family permease
MKRVGARLWIARIMISWGLISAAMMFAHDIWTFYSLRVLLGIAEAGFFPGIILYLSFWFPDRERAKMTAFFMMAIAFANVFGSPLSGFIMDWFDGAKGLHGWQWLFVLEGLPASLVGVAVLFYLSDTPRDARWLSDKQRSWLIDRMADEERVRLKEHGPDRWQAMLQPRVWLLIAIYFTVAVGTNAGAAYFPTLIKAQYQEATNFQIGGLTALPHLCALVVMSLVSISSDRSGERRWHLAGSATMAAVGWGIVAWAPTSTAAIIGLCVAQAGMMSMMPVFWTIPSSFLTGMAAAGGIALINSTANIGGFFGAWFLGRFGAGAMSGVLLAGGLLTAATIRNFKSTGAAAREPIGDSAATSSTAHRRTEEKTSP